MILMAVLGLVMMMTSGVAGKTYLVETADGSLPSLRHGAQHPRRAVVPPTQQGIITISALTFLL